ncbi:cell division GTPase [Thermoplasma acidophilum]|nr:cell division GTPase [Thermoplasma acidophilum]
MIHIQRRFEVFESGGDSRASLAELYYRQKANVAVVSIGNAGFRVIRKMRPIEVKNVDTYAIIQDDDQQIRTYDGMLSNGRGEIKISLYTLSSEKNPFFRYTSGPIKILNGGSSIRKDEEMFMKIADSAVAFVIVSGFGGNFSQALHLQLLGCLVSMGKETLSAVIIPGRAEERRRQKAIAGIRKMNKMNVPYVVFDNEQLNGPADTTIITERIDAANLKIADSLDGYISSISSSIDRLKYNLIEDARR